MNPGIHFGIPFDDYRKIVAVNQSRLKGHETAAHLKAEIDEPEEPTEFMDFGSAAHVAIFEPERFARAVRIAPPEADHKGRKPWKDWADQQPEGSILLKAEEGDRLTTVVQRVRAHKGAAALLALPGESEVCAVWTDAETGLKCKVRMDRVPTKFGAIVDLKTCTSATERKFSQAIYDYGYYYQAAWTLDAYEQITGEKRDFVIIAVEKKHNGQARMFRVNDASLALGRTQYRKDLRMLAECLRTGNWPGFPNEITDIDVPRWALEQSDSKYEIQPDPEPVTVGVDGSDHPF